MNRFNILSYMNRFNILSYMNRFNILSYMNRFNWFNDRSVSHCHISSKYPGQ